MRFNDGFWLLKNGVKPYYGLQAVQVTKDDTGYDLQVSTKPINHRGDTLGGMQDVIEVLTDLYQSFLCIRSCSEHPDPFSNQGCYWRQD